MIRYRLPTDAPVQDLPQTLKEGLDRHHRELTLTTHDLATTLEALLEWVRDHNLDLDSLEITRPSLEDAYLSLISNPQPPTPVHA